MTGAKKGLQECLQGELRTQIEDIWRKPEDFQGKHYSHFRGTTILETLLFGGFAVYIMLFALSILSKARYESEQIPIKIGLGRMPNKRC